jgi:hypothetical protein
VTSTSSRVGIRDSFLIRALTFFSAPVFFTNISQFCLSYS